MSKARPYHDELVTLGYAAENFGIPRSTLVAAISAGRFASFPTADDRPLVRMADVEMYAMFRPARGPAKKT